MTDATKTMNKAATIRAYIAAHPKASAKDVAAALGFTSTYVYQTVSNTRRSKKAAPQAEPPLTQVLRAQWHEQKQRYIEREIKLMGVIEYLESQLYIKKGAV